MAHSHSLVAGRYHYIRSADGRDELYDFEEDPGELRNLADSTARRRGLADLRGTLARILADTACAAVGAAKTAKEPSNIPNLAAPRVSGILKPIPRSRGSRNIHPTEGP
jgi:hypothetical protein